MSFSLSSASSVSCILYFVLEVAACYYCVYLWMQHVKEFGSVFLLIGNKSFHYTLIVSDCAVFQTSVSWSWDFILPNVNSSFVERRAASFHDFVVWRVSTKRKNRSSWRTVWICDLPLIRERIAFHLLWGCYHQEILWRWNRNPLFILGFNLILITMKYFWKYSVDNY